jgi:hypothetical protein
MTSYWHLLGEGTHTVNGKTVTVNLRELKKKLYLCLMSVNAWKRSASTSASPAPSLSPSAN